VKYAVTPHGGKPFEVEADDAVVAMAAAAERLGHDRYSIQRSDAVPALLFGQTAADGRVQL
jgi:hypothetical protein